MSAGSVGHADFEGLDLQEAAERQLGVLTDRLMRLGVQLDVFGTPDEHWGTTLRKMRLVHALGQRQLVAVAGAQGVGKTTAVCNLYPGTDAWLPCDYGRSEKTPVVVEERKDAAEPFGEVVRRRRWSRSGHKTDAHEGDGLTYTEYYGPERREEWRRVAMGEQVDVLLVTLVVPLGFLGVHESGFTLLPGLERAGAEQWQELIRMILATSRAALVVVDRNSLANAAQSALRELLAASGGQEADTVVAVSRCEAVVGDAAQAEELVARAADVYGVGTQDVVLIGKTPDSPEGWPARLREQVRRVRPSATEGRRLAAATVRQLVGEEVRDVVDLGREALEAHELKSNKEAKLASYLREFDESRDALLREFDLVVDQAFADYYSLAHTALLDSLKETRGEERWQRFRDGFTGNRDDWLDRLQDLVATAWNPQSAREHQHTVLDQAVSQWWGQYARGLRSVKGSEAAAERVMDALGGGWARADTSDAGTDWNPDIVAALQALPGIALEARAFALSFVDASGTIDIDPSDAKLHEKIDHLSEDFRKTLIAMRVLIGGGVPGPGEEDLKSNLTFVVGETRRVAAFARNLLGGPRALGGAPQNQPATPLAPGAAPSSGAVAKAAVTGAGLAAASKGTAATTAAAATTTATGAAAGTGAGVGAAAGVGAGEAAAGAGTVAAASLAAALTAVAVGAAITVAVHKSNKALREWRVHAQFMLGQWRDLTIEGIRKDVEHILAITRAMAQHQLAAALGLDDGANRRFALERALTEVDRAKVRVLELLGDDHVG